MLFPAEEVLVSRFAKRSVIMSTKLETKTYSKEGKEVGTVQLPNHVFGVSWNADLVHQVVVAQQANARTQTTHAKDRSAVRGGGRKPWRQKGTGRARHGSRRSPIWRGGGVTHGPLNTKNYTKAVPKKMRTKALAITLSRKQRDKELLFVETLAFSEPSTKEAKETLAALGRIKGFEGMANKKTNAVLMVVPEHDSSIKKSFRNFGNVAVEEARNLSPLDVLSYNRVIITDPNKSLSVLGSRIQKKIS